MDLKFVKQKKLYHLALTGLLILTGEESLGVIRAYADSCPVYLNPTQYEYNLTAKYKSAKKTGLNALLKNHDKTWVLTSLGEYRAYSYIAGKPDFPLFVMTLGLGDSIEQALSESQVIRSHMLRGHHILVLEGSKQGDTAIASLLDSFSSGFETNMQGFVELFNFFLKEENPRYSEIIIAGHSYGAYGASYLASALNTPITLQLYAPAVTNFNNRFNPDWLNAMLNRMSNYLDIFSKKMGYNYQVKEVSKFLLISLPYLAEDPLKLRMASELTVDAGIVHLMDHLIYLPKDSRVQIIAGENENFVFPMMHYELFESLVNEGVSTQFIEISGVNHYVPSLITSKQQEALLLIHHDKDIRKMFLKINRDGRIVSIRSKFLLKGLKEKSIKIWKEYLSKSKYSSGFSGPTFQDLIYPDEWEN